MAGMSESEDNQAVPRPVAVRRPALQMDWVYLEEKLQAMQLDTLLDMAWGARWGAVSPSYLKELADDSKEVADPDSVCGNPSC